MTRHWIAVASADHVRTGRAQGFMQVCHGKPAPLRRIHPGDWVAYYSPTEAFRGKQPYRLFTALGEVREGQPYQVEMTPGFHPFRRDVIFHEAEETPIAPLLPILDFTRNNRNWGYQLRFGLFAVTAEDMARIARAMQRPDHADRISTMVSPPDRSQTPGDSSRLI